MRVGGVLNTVMFASATAVLMGVVTKQPEKDDFGFAPSTYKASLTLPPDTPEVKGPVDLLYPFNDNNGNAPLLEPKSKLYLETPENIKTEVEYNPQSGTYDVKQKVGEQDYRPETYMNLKEYKDYMFRKQMRDYWRSRVAADELANQPRKGMIPKLQVNSELFNQLFGGNTVDIKPTGTAELIFGLNHTKNLNPAIPQRQQRVTNFDFNMRIQLNLIGKIGEKLKVTTNYNTEASFDWENQVKVDYTGLEDEIIKKIEAGNVTLPLNSSLISGSQTLFGFKTELQFGKLRSVIVMSQQRGKKTEITVQGNAQTTPFSFSADNYETNKHYFLGHYFRKNYDAWMSTLPVITTPITITKVEVYVLGINGNAEQTRNVVAFEDLGEYAGDDEVVLPSLKDVSNIPSGYEIRSNAADTVPSNAANNLYSILTNSINGLITGRTFTDVAQLATAKANVYNKNNPNEVYMVEGRDFTKIQNARRLNSTDYTLNTRTGFISLNQALNNDQALAVSYQYQVNGRTYQVGEFSENIPDNSQILICKLLKTNSVSVRHPMWKLMMKNVYTLGAYNLNPQDFRLDVYYNNIETGVDVPYLPDGAPNGKQLIRVLKCDRLSVNGDRIPDGVYDFIPGYTIIADKGRAYFPTVEPFGRSLAKEFAAGEEAIARKYVFNELYDSTRTAASFIQEKNRFKIKGSYRSSSGSEITLNAINIPAGAVVVTANGVTLIENTDYTVDYTLGRVRITNEGILNSGATIKVSLESNTLFSIQQKSLWGTRLDYTVNRDLKVGGTFLRFSERPMTAKVSLGEEPVSNIVGGVDFNYKADAPYLTRVLDKLPLFSTKEMSNLTARGEIAKLFPGNAKAINQNGGNSYIDDFEGSIGLIDVKGASSWILSSVPGGLSNFPEAAYTNTIIPGINRARLNWYQVDNMFTRDQSGTTPSYYASKKLFSNNMWRQVFETELFPGKTPPNGQQVVLPLLDLVYYPTVRGPYNYDVKGVPGISKGIDLNGNLNAPESRWGGIMRRLETNDFQSANVEYIQFWLMDPYNEDYNQETDSNFIANDLPKGDLYINLGNVSEDIVKDDRMTYENGIPGESDNLTADYTAIARVPNQQPIVNSFSANENDRARQDVGYDGLTDDEERRLFEQAINDMNAGAYSQAVKDAFAADPSSDNYHHFRGDDYDASQANTLKRYSLYNNPQANTPTESQYKALNNAGYQTLYVNNSPNIEDVNRDNNMSVSENYYQYHLKISPNDISPANVGNNFLVDAFEGTAEFSGETKVVKWYQFKIPISQFESNVGGIEGFNSIRFMRVYLKGFKRPVVLRMARFELVRSDWRRYQFDLREPGENIVTDNNGTSFDISAVSLQENATKQPVNYVLPPLIQQQQNVQTTNLVLMNEQALQMRVCDLKDGDSRAIFKNVDLDTRMFKNIKMNVHAEKSSDATLKDGDLHLFFRVGTDYNNNYYEYELPLKLTPEGTYDANSLDARYQVWREDNEVNFRFDEILAAKNARNEKVGYFSDLKDYTAPFSIDNGSYTVTIVGNPNLATIKSIMVGIRNPKTTDKLSHCAEVWINELRLTDFNNEGGFATTGQVQAKLADLGNLSLAGTYKSPYWGSVESKINDRSRETNTNWDVSSSINGGKFFPADWKVSLPLFFNYGQTRIIPLFSPLDPDVKTTDVKKMVSNEVWQKIDALITDQTTRRGINFSSVRIDGFKKKGSKHAYPWDVSNFNFTYAFNEVVRRNASIEYNTVRTYRGNLQYMFQLKNPYVLKPFTKVKFLQNKWFALIKDFNLQLMPNSFGAAIDVNRNYTALKNRDITSLYANSSDFPNPVLVNKNFLMNRNYNLVWAFNKSIKFDYTATNEGRIIEPVGELTNDSAGWRETVIKTFRNGMDSTINGVKYPAFGKYGENTIFRQQMNLNVELPLNKFPLLDFTKVSYRFGGTYTWNRQPFAANDSIGNTIQNTGAHNITASFNMMQLYNKVPWLKKINNPPAKPGSLSTQNPKAGADRRPGSTQTAREDSTKNNFKDFAELVAKTLMMLKNVSGTFQLQTGQLLPNFKPRSQYAGMDFSKGANYAPGFMFTTGMYDEGLVDRSIENGWITRLRQQTTPYSTINTTNFNYRASIEPHKSLKIELTGNYSKSLNASKYIVYNDSLAGFNTNLSPSVAGNFQITTFSNFNLFRDGNDQVNSALFEKFLVERQNIAAQLSGGDNRSLGVQTYTVLKAIDGNTVVTTVAYFDGYSDNQQDVLLGAFNKVYANKKTDAYNTQNIFPTIPLPNWNLTWDGLGKVPAFKKLFKSIMVRNTYRSTYAFGNFSNNLLFNNAENIGRVAVTSASTTANFAPYYSLNTVTLRESFEPLVKFDLVFNKPGWSGNLEAKRDKSTSLNLTAFQIIETKGQEYVIGAGYMYPRLRLKRFKIQGKVLESNLTVKLDISYRRNVSVIRQTTDGASMPTGGTNIFTMRSSADYQITSNVALRLYYDWVRTKPVTSASFPTASVNGGFSLRITFQ